MKDVKRMTVKYNQKIVGYLTDTPEGICFQYDDEWIKTGFSISPFSLPLDNKKYYEKTKIFKGLFGVFQDSLPDWWGELLIRRMLISRGINYDKLTPLQKLMLINKDGLGALTYEPSEEIDNPKINFDLDKLAEAASNIYNDSEDRKDLDLVFQLGGSSAGARPKAHLKFDNKYYIIKFPCSRETKDVGINEYKANLLAKQCGINVNECKVFESKLCKGYFGAQRFDRDDKGRRIHMISLSSLLETSHWIPTLDYKILLQVIQIICVDKSDMLEAYRRMCFNVFYDNRDDHGRNFAFLYDEKLKGYKLSPAFDITKSNKIAEHQMMVCGNGKPTEADLIKLAKEVKLSMKTCLDIIKQVKDVLKVK